MRAWPALLCGAAVLVTAWVARFDWGITAESGIVDEAVVRLVGAGSPPEGRVAKEEPDVEDVFVKTSTDPRVAEHQCLFMHELNHSVARHRATLDVFERIINASLYSAEQVKYNDTDTDPSALQESKYVAARARFSCGCLRLDDGFNASKSCREHTKPRSAECLNSKWKWIVLVGDSTLREMLDSVLEATVNDSATKILYGKNVDDQERTSKDYIIYSLHLVVCFRNNLSMGSSHALNLVRRPHEFVDLIFPANTTPRTRRYFSKPFMTISDIPRFIHEPWNLVNISRHQVDLMERCGPELFIMSSGLWENDGFEPEFETRECGMPAQPTIRMLWDRRLRTVFGEACELYGNRFIWRTSPNSFSASNEEGTVRFAHTNELNYRAKHVAEQYGVQVMDYHALFDSMGLLSKDHAHPIDIVRLRCWANILEYASKVLGDSHMLPFANRLQALYRIQLSEFRLFLSSINASPTKVDYKANMGVNYTGRYYWGKTSTRSRVTITPWTYDRVSRISEELSREEKSLSAPWSVKVPHIET